MKKMCGCTNFYCVNQLILRGFYCCSLTNPIMNNTSTIKSEKKYSIKF